MNYGKYDIHLGHIKSNDWFRLTSKIFVTLQKSYRINFKSYFLWKNY